MALVLALRWGQKARRFEQVRKLPVELVALRKKWIYFPVRVFD